MDQRQGSYASQKLNDFLPAMLQQTESRMQAAYMSRDRGSGSSFASMSSRGSYHNQPYLYSACANTPESDYNNMPENDVRLRPFNIEEEGDPDISSVMYYDFVVTKTEA